MTEINVQIIVDVPATGDVPAFRDAVTVPMSEYEQMSPEQVEALTRERYDAWREHILNPPEPELAPEVAPEDRQVQLAALAADVADLSAQLQALVAQEQPAQDT